MSFGCYGLIAIANVKKYIGSFKNLAGRFLKYNMLAKLIEDHKISEKSCEITILFRV